MESVYPALNSRYALILSGDSPKIYSAYTYREAAHAESSIEYQTMNRSAADVLALCTGVNSIDDIVAILSEKYGESAEKTRAFVENVLLLISIADNVMRERMTQIGKSASGGCCLRRQKGG